MDINVAHSHALLRKSNKKGRAKAAKRKSIFANQHAYESRRSRDTTQRQQQDDIFVNNWTCKLHCVNVATNVFVSASNDDMRRATRHIQRELEQGKASFEQRRESYWHKWLSGSRGHIIHMYPETSRQTTASQRVIVF